MKERNSRNSRVESATRGQMYHIFRQNSLTNPGEMSMIFIMNPDPEKTRVQRKKGGKVL